MICCGKELEKNKLGVYVCDKCGKEYHDEIDVIENALKKHPGANSIDLMRYTGLSSKTIIEYMQNGNIVPVEREKEMKGYYAGEPNKAQWHIDIYKRNK